MAAANRIIEVRGVRVPTMMYGTAWKEDRTAALVRTALEAGFRGIDTANQRRHYHEAAVGEAVQGAIASGLVSRDELFLQTKFTYRNGHDHRLPYDPKAPLQDQVRQSFESSLAHLGVDGLDAYVLHGPSTYPGLGDADWETWAAMEDRHNEGRVRLLGVSNVTGPQLEELFAKASVKPSVVQNRTFTRPRADLDVRDFCQTHGLVYEGFSLLTAIPALLVHPVVADICERSGLTAAQAVFRYLLDRGMTILTGTTSEPHMVQDLATHDAELQPDDRDALARLLG